MVLGEAMKNHKHKKSNFKAHKFGDHYDRKIEKNLFLVMSLNLIFAIIELIGGVLSNSTAIFSDALHDFGDALTILITIIFNRKATATRSIEYPFGKSRYKLVASVFLYIVLIVLSSYIIFHSLRVFKNPEPVNTTLMMVIAVFGIVCNGVAVLLLRNKKKTLNAALLLHLLEDTLGWISVLIGGIVIKVTGLYVIDPIISIVIAVWVIYNALKKIRLIIHKIIYKMPFDESIINSIYKEVNDIVKIAEKSIKVIEIDDNSYVAAIDVDVLPDGEQIGKVEFLLRQHCIDEIYWKKLK